MFPSILTHSWSFVYFSSAGILILFKIFFKFKLKSAENKIYFMKFIILFF
jgi:hypothetical protein